MEELNGYTPPVSLNLNDFQYDIGDSVVRCIAKMGIQVNQEALLKALKYDRGQYKAGYDAGFADGFIETLHTVRCRDCKHMRRDNVGVFCKVWDGYNGCGEDGFCCYGERRELDGKE